MHRYVLWVAIANSVAMVGCTPGAKIASCPTGYSGDGTSCTDVDECAAAPSPCHGTSTCANTVGSFECTCPAGFHYDGSDCVDTDECAAHTATCSADATCTNTPGAYTCACKPGFTGDGTTCTDVDECAAAPSPCHGTSTCANTVGSFECTCPTGFHYDGSDCVDTDECAAYVPVSFDRPDGDTSTVDRITDRVWLARGRSGPLYNAAVESAAAPGGCDTTSPADTEWARGSCAGNRGPFVSFPQMASCSPQSVVGQTVCLHLVSDDLYYDVDFSSYSGGGTGGGFAYTRTLVIGGPCGGVGSTGGVASCTNTVGSYSCDACLPGFELSTDANPTCVDVDECADLTTSWCDPHATCTNRVGTYDCACDPGYMGDPYDATGSCYDIDECAEAMYDCDPVNGTCTNVKGGYTCGCTAPATLAADGKTCLVTCDPPCGTNEVCAADGVGASCACADGYAPDPVNGGCKLPDRCSDTTTVSFRKPGFTDGIMDCIVPDVCITRGMSSGLYNAVVEDGTYNSAASPTGTLWAMTTCANATTGSYTFDTFQSTGHPVGSGMCMYLPEHGLYYDVTLTEWASATGGGFAYVRTAFQPDGCGVTLDASAPVYATCSDLGGCSCPSGWSIDPTSGKCRLPDPCATSGCDASATCDRTGFDTYRCECNAVDFVKDDYATAADCIRPDVCLTRGDYAPLYNAAQEGSAEPWVCNGIDSPLGTLWTLKPCADAVDTDFGTFLSPSFAACGPPRTIVGRQGCLKLLAAGPYAEETWDIEFSSWTSYGSGGGFAYRRWKAVGDATACH